MEVDDGSTKKNGAGWRRGAARGWQVANGHPAGYEQDVRKGSCGLEHQERHDHVR